MPLVMMLIGLLLIVAGILAISGLIISKKPEAKAPKTKYFMAASVAAALSRRKAARE